MFRFIFSLGFIALTFLVVVVAFLRESSTSTEWLAFTDVSGDVYRVHTVTQHPVKVSDIKLERPALSPDGQWLVFPEQTESGMSLMKAPAFDTTTRQVLWDGDGHPIHTRWSPDNEWIAFIWAHGTETNLSIIRLDGSGYRKFNSGQVSSDPPVWSPDSMWLYYAAPDNRESVIMRSNISTDNTEVFLRGGSDLTLSPDGTRLAYVEHSGSQKLVTIINVDTENEIAQVPFFSLSPFWSRDGTTLYFSDFRDGNLWEFNLDTNQGQQLTFQSKGSIYARLWDGDCLIAEEITHGAMDYEIYLLRICGQKTTLLTPQFDLVYGPFWIPHEDEPWHPWGLAMGALGLGGVGLLFRRR